jgi:hypothetical protein
MSEDEEASSRASSVEPSSVDCASSVEPPPAPFQEPAAAPPAPEPEPLLPTGEHSLFDDVVQACIVDRAAQRPHVAPPRCFTSLQAVSEEDVRAYRNRHPERFANLERRIADAARRLHADDGYRALALYGALLTQGIDLFEIADGPMTQGVSGEVCQRFGAVIKQGMRAHADRTNAQGAPTMWFVILVVLAGLVLVVVVALLAIVIHRLTRNRRTGGGD